MTQIICPKHKIPFEAIDGCPKCLEEKRDAEVNSPAGIAERVEEAEAAAAGIEVPRAIVKVRYFSQTTGELSPREYSYYTEELLQVGDVVMVPVRDTTGKAKVTVVNVPESEIEAFKDKVKTIPAGSRMPGAQASFDNPAPDASQERDLIHQLAVPPEEAKVGEIPLTDEPTPPALVTIEKYIGGPVPELLTLYQEAAGLLRYAKDRVIDSNEDLKPATNDLALIATCKKRMEARRKAIVGPMRATIDMVNSCFNDLMFPVLEADRLTREKVNTFTVEAEQKAAEAKRIEDEKLRLAQAEERLTGEHTVELGTAEVPEPQKVIRTGMGTVGGRSNWKARVIDFAALPDEYKLPNEAMLNAYARTHKGQGHIPGVEFYDDRAVTVRAK